MRGSIARTVEEEWRLTRHRARALPTPRRGTRRTGGLLAMEQSTQVSDHSVGNQRDFVKKSRDLWFT